MKIALLGEPDTGKSSYLVVLASALSNRAAAPLELIEVLDDLGFINRGLEALAQETRVKRTDADAAARLALRIDSPEGEVEVDVPDRSGELLKVMLNNREWDPDLLASLDVVDGAFLFLNVLRTVPGQAAEDLDSLLEGGTDNTPDPAPSEADPVEWAPALMPTDVRAVDLLQAILSERETPLPLGVMLSAWDAVSGTPGSPMEWFERRFPLLQQYLATRQGRLPHAVFGISAQGFDFRHPGPDAADVRGQDPWDRATVLDGQGNVVSIGAPLLWLAAANSD